MFTIKGPERTTTSVITFGTVLPDGVTYRIRFEWLRYEGYWIFTWADVQGRAVLAGLRVVANFNLLHGYSDPRLPAGSIIAHDTRNLKQPPGRNDWRERHVLLFIPDEDTVEVDPVSARAGT